MKEGLYDPAFLQRLETLSLTVRRVSGGKVRGERRGPRQGVGVEFCDYRAYVPGDDIRYLDWNVYRRLDRLVLKLFVEEEDLSVHLLLDGSASMGIGTPSKFEYALKAAAALAYIALSSHERVAVALFNGGVESSVGPVQMMQARKELLFVESVVVVTLPPGQMPADQSIVSNGRFAVVPRSDESKSHTPTPFMMSAQP